MKNLSKVKRHIQQTFFPQVARTQPLTPEESRKMITLLIRVNASRARLLSFLLLIVEFGNLLYLPFTNAHGAYNTYYIIAGSFMCAISLAGVILLKDSTRRHRKSDERLSAYLMGYWFGTVFSFLSFVWLDFLEQQSLVNAIILIALLALVPIFSLRWMLFAFLGSTAVFVVMSLSMLLPARIVFQSLMLGVGGILIHRMFYHTYINLLTSRLQLEQANWKLKQLAETDPLTGLLNRRGLEKRMELLFGFAQRNEQPIAALLIDLDFFKDYNDQHGHMAGDDCLKFVSGVLKSHCRRATDVAARVGGEEFIVLLYNTPIEEMIKVGLAIKKEIEQESDTCKVCDPVTISLGGTTIIPNGMEDFEQLYQVADQALYQAKGSGRNCLFAGGQVYR